jgi:hypothetical protein
MENKDEMDFELVDSHDGGEEEEQDAIEQDSSSDTDNDEEETSQKNPSNWKKMSKKLKWAEAYIKELENKLAKTGSSNNTELRLYFVENPEAKPYKEKMLELMAKPEYKNIPMEDVLELAKLKTPKESQDSTDFDFKSRTTKQKKTLAELTEEEALKLENNKDFYEWSKLQKKSKVGADIWG